MNNPKNSLPRLKIPIITEGKYDKIKLQSVVNARIITTEGFGVFKSDEKKALIKALGKNGIVMLCDSDGGGKVIRSHLRGSLSGIKIYDLYIPQIEGKERRKKQAGKAGLLGVEGVPSEVLRELFAAFRERNPQLFEDFDGGEREESPPITTAEMFELGLTGSENSAESRDRLCEAIGLPKGMSAKALREALEALGITKDELRQL